MARMENSNKAGTRLRCWLATFAVLAGVMSPLDAYAAPPNDVRYGAVSITTLPFHDSVDTTTATGDILVEGDGLGNDATVWFRLQLQANTPVDVSTRGSSFDTAFAVYRQLPDGSLQLLSFASQDPWDSTIRQAGVAFGVRAGDTILFHVGGEPDDGGLYDLAETRGVLQFDVRGTAAPVRYQPPLNDDRSSATDIDSLPLVDTQILETASTEPNEPGCAVDPRVTCRSIWYSWTASGSRLMSFEARAGEGLTLEVIRAADGAIVARGAEFIDHCCALGMGAGELTQDYPPVLLGTLQAETDVTYLFRLAAPGGQAFDLESRFVLKEATSVDLRLTAFTATSASPEQIDLRLTVPAAGPVDPTNSRLEQFSFEATACPLGGPPEACMLLRRSRQQHSSPWVLLIRWDPRGCVGKFEVTATLRRPWGIDPLPSNNVRSLIVDLTPVVPGAGVGACPYAY